MAIEHNYKEFVGHMYCQQTLRQEWHGQVPWLGKTFKFKCVYSLLLLVLIPFILTHWFFVQIGKDIQYLRKKKPLPDGERLKEMSRKLFLPIKLHSFDARHHR